MKKLLKDASVTGLVAGFIVTLVGMTSSAVLIFQAAQATGATPEEASSWLGSLCLGMGFISIVLSIHYRSPVVVAWSTAGAALLVTGLRDVPLPEAVGAFVVSALLILICGFTGIFERMMNRIPMALAAALLAGVLVNFSLGAFIGFKTQPLIIGVMFLSYLLSKKFCPRWTMLMVLVAGVLTAGLTDRMHFSDVGLAWTHFVFTLPHFSVSAVLSIGLPLFIVTMASQNLTGITVMRANGFSTPVSPLLTWTGVINLITAPFGGFAINLAAVTAALAMGPEAHPLPRKRYFAAVVSGVFYLLIGLSAGTVTSLFAAFPHEMVMGIAGFALLGTISSSLFSALKDESDREAAFITFAVTASGLTLFGVGAAFWGLIAGAFTKLLLHKKKSV